MWVQVFYIVLHILNSLKIVFNGYIRHNLIIIFLYYKVDTIMKIYKSFQFKLFLLQAVLIISILSLFATISLNSMLSYTELELQSRLNSDRKNLSEMIRLNLDNVENSMSFLINSSELKNLNIDEFDILVQNIISNIPIITQIYIIDKNGIQTYKSSYPNTLGDRSDRDYFQKAIKGEQFFSDVIVSRSTDESIVVYAAPIESNNKIIGVLGCSINLNFLSENLTYSKGDISVAEDMYGFIVDREGTVIAHPNKDFIAQRLNVSYLDPVKKALRGNSGIGNYIFENTNKIVSFAKLENTGWGVFVQVPQKTAFLGIDILKRLNLILLIVLIIVSIFISYFVSRYTKKPISNILNMISQLGNQRNIITKTSTRNDEFGIIENAFISMANTIIDDQNKLESRIQQRTTELTITMSELIDAQKKIMLTEKMNSLNKFISNLAHEINTPLGNVLTSVTFTEKVLSDLINSLENGKLSKSIFIDNIMNIIESVDIIKDQVIKSKDLLNVITMLNTNNAFIDSTIPCIKLKSYLNQYEFDLSTIIDTTEHRINLELQIPENFCIIYPEKLLQILKILIKNSTEHAFSENFKGIINIDITKDNEFLYIIYSNNGNSIPTDYLNHIFEPFFKGNMGGQGKGLGLTIIYELVVNFFEGEISCKNIDMGGVEFKIIIPLTNLYNDSCDASNIDKISK